MRGQANLPSLALALIALTIAAGIGIALADASFADGSRDAGERRIAVSLSERLVSADARVTSRANVFDASAVERLNESQFRTDYPVVGDRPVWIRLDDEPIVDGGDVRDGTTVRRIVLVERRQETTLEPTLDGGDENEVTLPRRTDEVTLRLDPEESNAISTVRTNGRVTLHNESGLSGTFTVSTSRFETITLEFSSADPLSTGAIEIAFYPRRTTKRMLEVTVGG